MGDWDVASEAPAPASGGGGSWDVVSEKPGMSATSAAGRGAAQGLSFGFSDELRGLAEAGGAGPNDPASLYNVVRGGYRKLTGDQQADQAYATAAARERAANTAAETQHPWAYGGGELAGTVGSMAALPISGGAGLAGRAVQGAKLGAVSGALSGAGETEGGLTDRLEGAAKGAGEGLIGGALSAPIASAVEGVGKVAYDALGKPIVSTVRGLYNPEGEAARRVVGGIERDITAGNAGLAPSEYMAAKAAGEPVALTDMGGPTTQALARSAANTSPEARGALEQMTQERFYSQNERASDLIRGLVATPANANATRDALQAAAKRANQPFYAQAYQDGQSIPLHGGYQQLLEAPAVRDAVRQATVTGANKAAAAGFKPVRNPFTFDASGTPSLTNPNVTPSLQFWDQVKQNMDDKIGTLLRGGEKKAAGDIIALKNNLVSNLDQDVPSYARARGVAANFFGADDALEAGEKAVNWRGDPAILQKQMAKMSQAERDLFREGYASSWADKVRAMADNRDVTKAIYQSPQARQVAQTVFGPNGTSQMEAFLHRERIMNFARNAVSGNSSTARQLIEAGLAGGAIGGYLGGHDPMSILQGAGKGAGLAVGVRAGAGKLIGYVDQKVARRVGELLASDDPSNLKAGIKLAAAHKNVLNNLRSLDTRLASSAALRATPQLPRLQGPAVGNAQPDQSQVPGPPSQQKNGGAVGGKQGFAHGGRVSPLNINHTPTEAQKKAGNYAKDHVNVHGLDITIENARGAHRSGMDKGGKPWRVRMPAHYGYVKGTEGKDGDHVDVYLGPHIKSPKVFIIDQIRDDTRAFDEHKCFLGFPSKSAVIATYHKAFSDGKGPDRFGHITEMPIDQFKQWLESGDTKKPLRYEKAAA